VAGCRASRPVRTTDARAILRPGRRDLPGRVWNRRPTEGLVHHRDQGCQYTSLASGRRLREAGLVASMASVGDCYDNTVTESFFAPLECELLQRHRFRTHTQARMAVFDDLEGFYNPHRRHSMPGQLSGDKCSM
jgi:putative transposase